MLKLKLSRRGKKKQPSYRLIAVDNKKDPQGVFKEDLGFYHPRTKRVGLKTERIKYWLEKGAQPTVTVHNLLVKEKIITKPKIKLIFQKKTKEEQSTIPNKSVGEIESENKTTT
ncbi:MAG: 30S ribosomal protein S16 [Patescibacteria group bacterium]|nr:30S ribosomal protein S16 [Patescibacteria group bacterium]